MSAEMLRRTFADHEYLTPDAEVVAEGIRAGIAARRRRRRNTAIGAVAAGVAVLLVITLAQLLPRTSPPATPHAPTLSMPFSLEGFPADWRSHTVLQARADGSWFKRTVNLVPVGDVDLWVWRSSELGVPVPGLRGADPPSGEAVTVRGRPGTFATAMGGDQRNRVYWSPAPGWTAMVLGADPTIARNHLLSVADAVDFRAPEPLRFPYRLDWVPEDADPVEGQIDASTTPPRLPTTTFGLRDRVTGPAIQIGTGSCTGVVNPNFSVGALSAVYSDQQDRRLLTVWYGQGLCVSFGSTELGKDDLVRMAENLAPVGDPEDPTTWTDRPIG